MLSLIVLALVPMSDVLPFIPDWNALRCISYADFADTVATFDGAKLTQTIETPSFPGLSRLLIVTYRGTKELFGGRGDCVMVPAIFVDHKPDAKLPLPILMFSDDTMPKTEGL